METHEAPAIETTPTEASDSFLGKLGNRVNEYPPLQPIFRVLSGTKTTAALTTFFGLSSAAQVSEGSAVGAVMTGLIAGEMAVLTGVNAVRNRKANQQQEPQ